VLLDEPGHGSHAELVLTRNQCPPWLKGALPKTALPVCRSSRQSAVSARRANQSETVGLAQGTRTDLVQAGPKLITRLLQMQASTVSGRSMTERAFSDAPSAQSLHFIKVVLRVWSMLGLYTISVPEFIFMCMV
jgi:hypothetical protein